MTYRKWDRASIPAPTYRLIERLVGFEPIAIERDGAWLLGFAQPTRPDGSPVEEGDTIDVGPAEQALATQLAPALTAVLADVTWQLNELQAAALIVFAHRHGVDVFEQSIIAKMANAGRLDLLGQQLGAWSEDEVDGPVDDYLRRIFTGQEEPESFAAYQAALATPLDALLKGRQAALAEAVRWGWKMNARQESPR